MGRRIDMAKGGFVWSKCLWAGVLIPLFCLRAPAQMITGEISGTIVDSSGAMVPEANVTLTDAATGAARVLVSSASGEFVFTAVRPGTYTVKVEKPGFKTHERKGVILTPNQRVPLGNIQLAVGQVTQTVEVTAQGEAVNTENADAVGSLSDIQVSDLAVKGRDVMQLLRVLPGVTTLTVVPWGEISDTDPAGTGANGGQFGSFTPTTSLTTAMACPSPSIGLALLASRWEVRLIFRTGSTPTKRSCSSSIRKKTGRSSNPGEGIG